MFDPTKDIIRLLEEGNYSEAYNIYWENKDKITSEKMESKLKERIEEIKVSFESGAKDYSSAKNELSTIQKMDFANLNARIDEIVISIDELNNSRIAYSTANTLSDNKDYPGAIIQYRNVSINDSNYSKANEELAKTEASYRDETLLKAENFAIAHEFQKADDVLAKALEILVNDPELVKQRNVYKSQEEQYIKEQEEEYITARISEADGYAKVDDYPAAIDVIEKALQKYKDNPDLIKKRDDLKNEQKMYLEKQKDDKKKSILAEAEEKANIGDYPGAIKILQDALSGEFFNDPDIKEKIAEYESLDLDSQVNAILTEADGYAVQGLEVKAMETISAGIEKFTGNLVLLSKLEEYKDKLGVNAKIVGNRHTDAVEIYSENWNSAVPFKLNGENINPENLNGIRFKTGEWFVSIQGYSNYGITNFSGIVYKIDNYELVYSKIIFKIAHDDLSYLEYSTNSLMSASISGYSKVLGFKSLISTRLAKDKLIHYLEADITGYEEIYIQINETDTWKNRYNFDERGYYRKDNVFQDYLLFFEPRMFK
jgi:tetratricopeptide (TPR) repeat protein